MNMKNQSSPLMTHQQFLLQFSRFSPGICDITVSVLRSKFMSCDNAGIQAEVAVTAPVEGNSTDCETTPVLHSKEHWSRKQWNNKKAQEI